MYVCMYTKTHIHASRAQTHHVADVLYICVHICVRMCICKHICIYIYVYIYRHAQTVLMVFFSQCSSRPAAAGMMMPPQPYMMRKSISVYVCIFINVRILS